jgi:hypothetical protein
MSEIKTLTAEELEAVKSIKRDYSALSISLGEIELQKASLDREKQTLLSQQVQLIEREETIAKSLSEKYGNGTIDIETGIISQ